MALVPEQQGEVVEALGGGGMLGAENLFADRQRTAEERLCLGVVALGPEQRGDAVEGIDYTCGIVNALV